LYGNYIENEMNLRKSVHNVGPRMDSKNARMINKTLLKLNTPPFCFSPPFFLSYIYNTTSPFTEPSKKLSKKSSKKSFK
jgi:hypothetical protein